METPNDGARCFSCGFSPHQTAVCTLGSLLFVGEGKLHKLVI